MEFKTHTPNMQEKIRLDAEGHWFQGEFPVLHDRTLTYFRKNIEVDDNNYYFLTGEEFPVYFDIADVAFWITRIEKTIAGFLITLSDDTVELLDTGSLWQNEEGRLYCLVKDDIPAKFEKAVQEQIADCIQTKQDKTIFCFGRKSSIIETKAPKQARFPRDDIPQTLVESLLEKRKKIKLEKRGPFGMPLKQKRVVPETKADPIIEKENKPVPSKKKKDTESSVNKKTNSKKIEAKKKNPTAKTKATKETKSSAKSATKAKVKPKKAAKAKKVVQKASKPKAKPKKATAAKKTKPTTKVKSSQSKKTATKSKKVTAKKAPKKAVKKVAKKKPTKKSRKG